MGNNFYDFLFTSLDEKSLSKIDSTLNGDNFLLKELTSIKKRGETEN